MKKYSYEDFLSKNRLYSGKTKKYRIVRVSEDGKKCLLTNNITYQVDAVIENVSRGVLTVENPIILKNSCYFGNIKYGVVVSGNMEWFDLDEDGEDIVNHNAPDYLLVIFNTEYEALLATTHFVLRGDSLGINENYSFSTKKYANQLAKHLFFHNFKKTFKNKDYYSKKAPTFVLHLEVFNRRKFHSVIELRPNDYRIKQLDMLSDMELKIVKLTESEVDNLLREGKVIATRKDIENDYRDL